MRYTTLFPLLLALSGCGAVAAVGVKSIKGSSDWAAIAPLDVDGSGSVSPREFQTLRGPLFSRFDRNQDAALSRAEYLAMLEKLPATKRIGKGDLAGVLREPFGIADRNQDATLSRQEFETGGLRLFTLLDQDGDGALQRQDFTKTRF